MEVVSWLDRYARMTRRLAEAVIRACERLPTLHVAQMFGLHWDTVRLLERRALQAALSTLPKAQPLGLIMEEFVLFKGHRYASVVLDADTRRVLWIGEGRSRAAVRPFFKELGPEGCARIEAVAMDMNTAYDLEVRQHCPKARVIYDLFHVVAKYGREVIDRVRVDEANRLRHDKPARKVIKQARWLLLRNPENLKKPEQQVHLQDLLAANQSLMTVYLMKAEHQNALGTERCLGLEISLEAVDASRSRKRNTRIDPIRKATKGLLAGHREPGTLANAHRSVGRNKQSNKGHQTNGLRLPGQRILFHEDQERLSRQSVKNLILSIRLLKTEIATKESVRLKPPHPQPLLSLWRESLLNQEGSSFLNFQRTD